jgi:hypothetical protein
MVCTGVSTEQDLARSRVRPDFLARDIAVLLDAAT